MTFGLLKKVCFPDLCQLNSFFFPALPAVVLKVLSQEVLSSLVDQSKGRMLYEECSQRPTPGNGSAERSDHLMV